MVQSVKIGPFEYVVELTTDLRDDDKHKTKLDGHLRHSRSKILLDNDMDKQATTQTLVHEIFHELSIQSGLLLMEHQVDALAFGIIQVMRDNPALVQAITEKGNSNA